MHEESPIDEGPEPKFIRVSSVSELTEGTMMRVELPSGEAVVIANVGNKYYAIGDVCTHEEFNLSDGTLGDHVIVCPGHGAEWNIEYGTAKFDDELPNEPVYEVKVAGEDVMVSTRPIKKPE